jgi:hypothetical protein
MATNEAIDPLNGPFSGPDPVPVAARAGRLRFRRRRAEQHGSTGADPIEEALAELVLLREENARLKAARHQVPSFGHVVGQMRAMPDIDHRAEDAADEAAEMLAEVVVLRDSLLEVCAELERAMATVRARLHGLGADAVVGPLDPVPPPGEEDFRGP